MSAPIDPVDSALHVLRDREWAAPEHRAHLKESLMNAFENHRTVTRRRRTLLIAGAGVLALSGLGFVAAQQLGWVRVTLRSEVNGQIVDRDLTPDENGQVRVTLDTADGPAEFAIPVPQTDRDEQMLIDATQEAVFTPADGASAPPR
jgi:hypothetical protein